MKKLISILLVMLVMLSSSAFALESAVALSGSEALRATSEQSSPAQSGVTTSRVNIRSKANSSSQKLGEIPKGKTVAVLSKSGDWYAIEYNGIKGYIFARYVKIGSGATAASTNNAGIKGDYKKGSVYGPKLTTKELEEVKKAVDNAIAKCISKDMTQAQKILALGNYLCSVCTYAPDWSKNRANTAWGALVYGQAQCSGYARAFKALCDAADIGCYYVHASPDESYNPEHQWNIISYNGKWYHIEPQLFAYSHISPIQLMSSYYKYDTKAYPEIASQGLELR